jgi:Nuclease-related domain
VIICATLVSVIRTLSYPRRQQLRRVGRAAAAAAGAGIAIACALGAIVAGLGVLSLPLLLVGAGLGLYASHWARLAGRSAVGARSEADVRRALGALEREGWRLRSSLPWGGRGDIDHVAIAATGIAFAIETKTRSYTADHLASVCSQAVWLQRRRRRWCPRGARPVLCVTCGPQVEQLEDQVLVVSVNRLARTLRAAAGTTTRPASLNPTAAG